MKTLPVLFLSALLLHPVSADRFDLPEKTDSTTNSTPEPTKEAGTPAPLEPSPESMVKATPAEMPEKIKDGAAVSELGLMRIFVVMDRSASGWEDTIHQELSAADFRVFPAKNFTVLTRMDPDGLREEGEKHQADLVCHIKVESEAKASLGDFKIFQSTVTSQIYSPVSGELISTHTSTLKGPRMADEAEARKGAIQAGIKDAIAQSLAKAANKTNRLLVHEVQLTGIKTETQLAEIQKKAASLEGATHVRRISFDAKTGHAMFEITAAPKTAETWRSFIEGLPSMKTPPEKIQINANDLLRKKHADWFAE